MSFKPKFPNQDRPAVRWTPRGWLVIVEGRKVALAWRWMQKQSWPQLALAGASIYRARSGVVYAANETSANTSVQNSKSFKLYLVVAFAISLVATGLSLNLPSNSSNGVSPKPTEVASDVGLADCASDAYLEKEIASALSAESKSTEANPSSMRFGGVMQRAFSLNCQGKQISVAANLALKKGEWRVIKITRPSEPTG